MDSFYKVLSDKLNKNKLTIFVLSCNIKYPYTDLYKAFLHDLPDTELILKLNRYFKTSTFSKFAQN